MSRIAVYSGSFNPLHKGHLAVSRHLLEVCRFERVLLIVTPDNPLRTDTPASTAPMRIEAARKAVARYPFLDITVSDIELSLPEPRYTIRTLDALRGTYPDDSFTLAIGADNLHTFRDWHDYARILLEYGVIAFPRKGFDIVEDRRSLMEENADYRIETADFEQVDISSTSLRRGTASKDFLW